MGLSGNNSSDTGGAAPLWQLLRSSTHVLQAVRRGQSATEVLAAIPSHLRAGSLALSSHALRHGGAAQVLRDRLVQHAPPPAIDALLCTALALMADPQTMPYPDHTLVSQTVECAKREPRWRKQAGFINACLRSFLREREALLASIQAQPLAQWNHPAWWIQTLQRDWPQHWQKLLRYNSLQAPMTLRINRRRASVAQVQAQLQAADIPCTPVGTSGLQLHNARPVDRIPGFAEGLWSVQDAAAQLAAPLLLGDRSITGRRVLDACAAPGGKTAHLLELEDCSMLALDVSAARCERIHTTLGRLGLQAEVRCADALAPDTWWDGRPFDAILLDAPCSGSGVVRHHPDIPWLRREADINRLASTQAALLKTLWPLLAPSGRLLYCTCSVFRDEGERTIQAFLAHNTGARLLPSPGALLPLDVTNGGDLPDNSLGAHDGFFYALLEKMARA